MYDYVNVEITCPNCKAKLDGFQSKDAHNLLDTIDPTEVYRFYTSCSCCGKWIEYEREYDGQKPPRGKPFNKSEIKELGFKLVEK